MILWFSCPGSTSKGSFFPFLILNNSVLCLFCHTYTHIYIHMYMYIHKYNRYSSQCICFQPEKEVFVVSVGLSSRLTYSDSFCLDISHSHKQRNSLYIFDSVIVKHSNSFLTLSNARLHIIHPRYLLYHGVYGLSTQRCIHPEFLNSNYQFTTLKTKKQHYSKTKCKIRNLN